MVLKRNVLVVFSGGQDSTTCLAWAMKKFQEVRAVTFDYGQRHDCEIESAKKIAKVLKVPLKVIKLPIFKDLTDNALLNKKLPIGAKGKGGLPTTYVDGRNHIFLSVAAIYAKQQGIFDLITGVCETDYSGYPDCRDKFIRSLEKTLSLAMDYRFKIHTPLMFLTKAETVKLIADLGKLDLLRYTHTCYRGEKPACGVCPACKLRLKGFREAKVKDPLFYV